LQALVLLAVFASARLRGGRGSCPATRRFMRRFFENFRQNARWWPPKFALIHCLDRRASPPSLLSHLTHPLHTRACDTFRVTSLASLSPPAMSAAALLSSSAFIRATPLKARTVSRTTSRSSTVVRAMGREGCHSHSGGCQIAHMDSLPAAINCRLRPHARRALHSLPAGATRVVTRTTPAVLTWCLDCKNMTHNNNVAKSGIHRIQPYASRLRRMS
jgi:hypothetical protein